MGLVRVGGGGFGKGWGVGFGRDLGGWACMVRGGGWVGLVGGGGGFGKGWG